MQKETNKDTDCGFPQKSNIISIRENCPQFRNKYLLDILYQKNVKALRTFLSSRVRSMAELEDVMQEVFSRLAKLDNLFEKLSYGDKSSRAFLFTAANNCIIDIERKKVIEKQFQHDEHVRADGLLVAVSPEMIVEKKEELDIIKQSIQSLRPTWRKAFVLHRFDNLSYVQIAEEMGISIKTVEKYITASLLQLRKTRDTFYGQKKKYGLNKHRGVQESE